MDRICSVEAERNAKGLNLLLLIVLLALLHFSHFLVPYARVQGFLHALEVPLAGPGKHAGIQNAITLRPDPFFFLSCVPLHFKTRDKLLRFVKFLKLLPKAFRVR